MRRVLNSYAALVSIFLITLWLAGCGASIPPDNNLLFNPGANGNLPGNNLGGGEDGSINGPGTEGGTIARLKPALAIRATGCIMCHGQVEANVITDFGRGDAYEFGKGASGISAFSGAIYGDHAQNWATAKIWGSVFVPAGNVTYLSGSTPVTTTLASFLGGRVIAPDASTPKPAITAQSSVFIGAPSAQKILGLGGIFPPAHPTWNFFPQGGVVSQFSGLVLNGSGNYLETIPGQNFVCDGDLVVNQVLFLNNLKLVSSMGCRIYSTKTVFVQGAVDYSQSGALGNLQITSARAVIMGLGHGPVTINTNDPTVTQNSVQYRLQDFWTRGGYFTRDTSATTQGKMDQIVADSNLIPTLTDAAIQPTGRGIGFSRILVNAPQFHSRYQGEFSGVIIAEVALASLNSFSFKFDDVFLSVPILPLLQQSDYLLVKE